MPPSEPETSDAPAPSIGRLAAVWGHRGRVIEAMVLLTAAGLAQRLVPMRFWARVLGRPASPPPEWLGVRVGRLPVQPASLAEARVARAVRRAARALPWEPTCLAEATAGQVLLRQAGRPGVVMIGLRPAGSVAGPLTNPVVGPVAGPVGSPTRWDAHAWLMGERGAITGGPAADGFTATTVYEVPGGLSASEVAAAGVR